MSGYPELELRIGSRFEELELVDRLVEEAALRLELTESEAEKLALAAREAAANAIQHGNGLDSELLVEIRVRLEPGAVAIVIRDAGAGFDLSALPDPLAPTNLLKPTGRGIFLMRQLMDEVEFEFPDEGGTVVTMRYAVAGNHE